MESSRLLLTRRQALQTGTGAVLAAASSRLLAGDAPLPLITKAIPLTGERLPVIGLGTDAFRTDARDNINAEILRMQQLGGTVIDTAGAYGDSEELIGGALSVAGIRPKMFVATKLTGGGVGGFFGGGETGGASFERSFKRLQTDKLDLLQIHNLEGVEAILPMMREWKQAGRIRYLGITTSRNGQHADMLALMKKYPVDFVQVDYSIGNRDAESNVLAYALEHKIAVLANLPLERAALIGTAGQRPLPGFAKDIDVSSWSQFLLKYVVSHPAITVAIPGSTKVAHLEDNQGAARGRLPDAAMRIRMQDYWTRL